MADENEVVVPTQILSEQIAEPGVRVSAHVNVHDMTPEAAGAWKQATYNQYAAPAIEESARYRTSVWAVLGLVAVGVVLRAIGLIDNLGAIMIAAITVLAVGPAASQAIKAMKKD